MGIACCSFMLTVHCRLGELRSSLALLVVNNKLAVSACGQHETCIPVNSKPISLCNMAATTLPVKVMPFSNKRELTVSFQIPRHGQSSYEQATASTDAIAFVGML